MQAKKQGETTWAYVRVWIESPQGIINNTIWYILYADYLDMLV